MMVLVIFLHALRGNARLAVEGLYWLMTRRRVRGWNMLYRAAMASSGYYAMWTRYSEPRIFQEIYGRENAFSPRQSPQQIHAIILTDPDQGGPNDDKATSDSLRRALGAAVTIHIVENRTNNGGGATPSRPDSIINHWLAAIPGIPHESWLLPVFAGDRLSPHLAQAIDHAIGEAGETGIIYWDEDQWDAGRRRAPFLKPDWDDLLYLSRDILAGASMIRMDVAVQAAVRLSPQEMSTPAVCAMLLVAASTSGSPPPYHFPMILVHRSSTRRANDPSARKAMIEGLWPQPVTMIQHPSLSPFLSAQFPLPTVPPSVSVVIATRDRVNLLKCCVDGVLATTYPGEIEIIIVDNDSVEPETLAYFEDLGQKNTGTVMRYPGVFNYSAINNFAVEAATGEFILLLNNDIEMLEPEWLSSMMAHAARPDVGAVGALLLYPDSSIQHAGVAIGVGNAAGHVHRKIPLDASGHQGMHRTTRRVSAATAACLLVRRDDFLAVGGLEDETFKVAFNDVDLCLKLARAGLRNIFVAEAILIHHESQSRGDDMLKENFARYSQELASLQEKWSTARVNDPYHHHLWLRSSEQCVLRP